jgi:hypothetical protein
MRTKFSATCWSKLRFVWSRSVQRVWKLWLI